MTARDLGRLDADDHEWLATVPARLLRSAPEPPSGRFNAGQKINYLLVCILLAGLLITGIDTILARTHHNLIFAGHKLATIGICVLDRHLRAGWRAHVHGAREPGDPSRAPGDADRRGRSALGTGAPPALGAIGPLPTVLFAGPLPSLTERLS